MAATNPDDVRMSLGDHLEELRKRLFLGLIGPVIFAVVLMFFAHSHIVPFLCQPLLSAMRAVGEPPQLSVFEVGEAFGVYLRVALIGGLILGIPWLGFQAWLFVAPAPYSHERRAVLWMIPGSAVLSIIGVVFMYYIMLPFTLWFLVGVASWFPMPQIQDTPITRMLGGPAIEVADDDGRRSVLVPILETDPEKPESGSIWLKLPENQLRVALGDTILRIKMESPNLISTQMRLTDYIRFVMWMALAFAVAFQLPLIMLAIAFVGVAGYPEMRRIWKFAMLACFIVGSLLTPADPWSMLALAIPLYLLYEFGLVLVRLLAQKRATAGPEDEE